MPFRPHALWHRQPVYRFGNHMTIVPSGTPVAPPPYTHALDTIGGCVVVDDFSARDVQRSEMQSGLGPQKSKHFLSSILQTLVTADEILPRVAQPAATVEINGRRVATAAGDRGHRRDRTPH